MIWTIPNALTSLRLLASLGVALSMTAGSEPVALTIAFGLFVAASATDWVDGYLARSWNQQSRLGEMLDPIADKALVLITLTVLVAVGGADPLLLLPVAVIVFREVFVSGMREYVAGRALSLPVTRLAKWKTTVQMIAIAGLLLSLACGGAGNAAAATLWSVSLGLLWIAAAMTLMTGWNYFLRAIRVFGT